MKPMLRTVYREHLEAFNKDVLEMCDAVRKIMDHASAALLEQSLEDAEVALTETDALKEISQRCEERSMSLLALHSPVAYDLRQVISAIYIVESFDRMGSLAKNVALLARQRHPSPVYPEPLHGYVQELARLVHAHVEGGGHAAGFDVATRVGGERAADRGEGAGAGHQEVEPLPVQLGVRLARRDLVRGAQRAQQEAVHGDGGAGVGEHVPSVRGWTPGAALRATQPTAQLSVHPPCRPRRQLG